jgi:GT2 family glycosyltransferase
MVSVIIVNYNGEKYLERNLRSLFNQSYQDLEVIMVDNASTDDSVSRVQREYPAVRILPNRQNLGFCAANNQGVKNSRGEWVMFLNQDVALGPDYLATGVVFLRQHSEVGAVQGKFLRMNFETGEETKIIDSAGIEVFKSGRAVGRGENQVDRGQFEVAQEIFGADAAAAVFRREALESIRVLDEYEDEDFFMYKDDIDLGWRLRLMGWQIWYLPQAVAYHARTSSGTGRSGSYLRHLLDFIRNERQKKDYVVGLSFKNQWLMLIKNMSVGQIVVQLPFILFREIQLLFFNLLFRPCVFLKYGLVFLKQLPRAGIKRRDIQSRKKVGDREIGRWFK